MHFVQHACSPLFSCSAKRMDYPLIDDIPASQTRAYEKLRFARVRQSQSNGEDLRDRWHNALTDVDDGVEIDPETVKIRVSHPLLELSP